jgi:hypothetical protein
MSKPGNPFWRSRPVQMDLLRAFAAHALRVAGATYAQVGELLGVSTQTAVDLARYGERWFNEGRI